MAKESGVKKQPGWLNRHQMADSLGITPPTLDSWGVEPVARIGRSKYFTAKAVVANRVADALERQARKIKPAGPSGDEDFSSITDPVEKLRARKLQEETRRLQNQNDILEGRSAPVDVIRQVLVQILGRTSSVLDSLPLNMKRQFPDLTERQVDYVRSEIVRHQNEAARADDYLDEIIEDVIREAEERVS